MKMNEASKTNQEKKKTFKKEGKIKIKEPKKNKNKEPSSKATDILIASDDV